MENKDIIKLFKQTSRLLELHNANPFKIRGYTSAVFTIEKLGTPLHSMSPEEIQGLEGIGKSMAKAIQEIIDTEQYTALQDLLDQTPPGVVEMLDIKGIGPKKIRQIWQELHLETMEDLLQASEAGKLTSLKGFGAKTQENIKQAILFKAANAAKVHYAMAEKLAEQLSKAVTEQHPGMPWEAAGPLRRKLEIIEHLDFVAAPQETPAFLTWLESQAFLTQTPQKSGPLTWRGTFTHEELKTPLPISIHLSSAERFANTLFLQSAAPEHLGALLEDGTPVARLAKAEAETEAAIYQRAGLPFIAPELREGYFELAAAKEGKLPQLVAMEDLKGILHNHSTYSDGKHSLEDMARYCQELGYQYLGITDHSKSAFYANGLLEADVMRQHQEIDALNQSLAPFKVFKGIESDILHDGSLDYDEDVLQQFDFIVASIHSGLGMDMAKATQRLITAIENPYTTMLGHMTGRLLLRREGYPVDHRAVIDACAEHGVIIEINAHPWRLDIDWRWVHYALEKGVLISINPDAHEKNGYHDMYYGLCVGRKGGLTAQQTFNAMSCEQVAAHFAARKEKAMAKA